MMRQTLDLGAALAHTLRRKRLIDALIDQS